MHLYQSFKTQRRLPARSRLRELPAAHPKIGQVGWVVNEQLGRDGSDTIDGIDRTQYTLVIAGLPGKEWHSPKRGGGGGGDRKMRHCNHSTLGWVLCQEDAALQPVCSDPSFTLYSQHTRQ